EINSFRTEAVARETTSFVEEAGRHTTHHVHLTSPLHSTLGTVHSTRHHTRCGSSRGGFRLN
ncbi:predicted protein, partial [Arabidopsis lyrata subsp. lyrata]